MCHETVTFYNTSPNFCSLNNEQIALTLENNNFDVGATVPKKLCKISGIEITIDQGIDCPGKCCRTVVS